jgi:hypothetical protein
MQAKITIAKPCHENWNKMSEEEQGRHCAVCSKVVKDFTGKKTEDILQVIKNAEEEVCGRIGIQHLTPANKKQKIFFWAHTVFYRKALYPLLAFLGVGFILKRTHAQTVDHYPIKGKMVVRDQHNPTKKITLIVKSAYNEPISGASIQFISGIKNQGAPLVTDTNGLVTLQVEAADIISSTMAIEISAMGYELKRMEVQLIKNVQTVEIKMNSEIMMLGQVMVQPLQPLIHTNPKEVNIQPCSLDTLQQLGITHDSDAWVNSITPDFPVTDEEVENTWMGLDMEEKSASTHQNHPMLFDLFPNPATSQVHIVANGAENFSVDIFDASGKKIHSIMHASQRYLLDVINYAPGVYYALIAVEGKAVETKKIVVAR